jgi:ABC-type polysaccharide/polyol phosphate transport system ATPase subunit
MSDPNFILSVEKLSKSFELFDSKGNKMSKNRDGSIHKHSYAIKDISFKLKKGEVLGIIGRNGSGKSTLLKIISGVLVPSSGHILYDGRLMSILNIGSGFHPELSGYDNIFFYGSMLGLDKNEFKKNINEIIDFSEIREHIHTPVKYYSSGMYLRLAFSVALFSNVDILILDEVISVGDTQFMIKCNSRLNQIIKEGLSIIIASHNMGDISRLCNNCLWIEKGNLFLNGPAEEVTSSYLHSIKYGIELSKKVNNYMEWPEKSGPKKDGFILASLKISNEGSSTLVDAINYNLPISFEIEYYIEQDYNNIYFFLTIIDQYNNPVLTTTTFFSEDGNVPESYFGIGKYKCKCVLHGQTLNIGKYTLNIRVVSNNESTLLNLTNLKSFYINSDSINQRSALLKTPYSISAVSNWEFKLLEPQTLQH